MVPVFFSSCWRALLLCLCLLPCLLFAQARPAPSEDVLLFTNGDQLSGHLLREVKGSVVFKSDMVGEITVPLDKIKELRTADKFAVLEHHMPVAQSRLVQPRQIQITPAGLISPESPAPPLAMSRVAYIVDAATFQKSLVQTPGFFSGWIGTATLGATFQQSTQHGGTLTAGVALTRQVPILTYFRPRNRMIVNVQETFGTLTTPVIPPTAPPSPDSIVKTSIFHADAERDQYRSGRTYLLAFTSFDHNFAQGLDLQQLYGAGFGFTPFSTPAQQLDLKADLHYAKQQFFDTQTNQNLLGSSFAETYRRSLPYKVQLTQALDVIPAWNQPNAYSANGSVSLVLPILNHFSFSNTVTEGFLNNPSPGYRKNSLTVTSGLTYAFH